MSSLAPYLWMFIGSIFFAIMSLLTESLGDEYSFAWIAAVRSGIATLLAVSIVWWNRKRLILWGPATLWWRSLAGCASMMCLFYAMTHYDVSVILSLSSMYPIWVSVLSWPLLGYLPSRDTWLALAISTIGMLMVYSAAVSDTTLHALHYAPYVAIPAGALAGLLSGIALIGLHKVKNLDPTAVVAHFSAVSTVIAFAIWAALPVSKSGATDNSSLLRLILVGVTAMLGQMFLTRAFAAGKPARVSVVGLSQVAIAASYKWMCDGRLPSMFSVIGMLLVIGATLWVMLRNAEAG